MTVVASGSKGNAVVVDFGKTRIAVDAGFGVRNLAKRFRSANIAPESVDACIVTHEHRDHAKGALGARRKWGWTLASTAPTLVAMRAPKDKPDVLALDYGSPAVFGDASVTLIKVSHDAVAPAAVLLEDRCSGARVGVAYDLGVVPRSLVECFSRLDILIVEANHDSGMLRAGPYPVYLQERIASYRGHLSNAQSASLARQLVHPGLRAVILAHLSEQNNTPQEARAAVGEQLRRTRFRGKLGHASQNASCAVGDVRESQLQLF